MKKLMLVIVVLPAIMTAVHGQTVEEKKASVAYVQKLQLKYGGFAPSMPPPDSPTGPTMKATSGALRALKYFGGEADKKVTSQFVEGCFDKASGGFSDTPGGKADVFCTSVGLMAVVELKLPLDTYAEPGVKYLAANVKTFDDIRIAAAALEAVGKRPKEADAWLEQVVKMRNPDGTFGKGTGVARETGGAVVAMLRLGGKLEQKENVIKALKDGQRADGGFGKDGAEGADLETSYRVMRAFAMLKEKPDSAKLGAFVGKCRNADGGYGAAPGQPSTVNSTYFASIILHWLEK